MDSTATLLAAGGAQADPDFPLDGLDLLPVLAGEGERKYFFNLAEDVREQADHKELEPELLARPRNQFGSWDQTLLPKKATI